MPDRGAVTGPRVTPSQIPLGLPGVSSPHPGGARRSTGTTEGRKPVPASTAKCAACQAVFAGPDLFDLHRTPNGACKRPADVTRGGNRVLWLRDGLWRGTR